MHALARLVHRLHAHAHAHAVVLALFATLVLALPSCLDTPLEIESEPTARVVVAWDPLDCGDTPHRIAVELEDDDGYPASTSTWCAKGSVELDVRHFGLYRGRVYAWSQGEIRAEQPMRLTVDAPVIRWFVPTPR